jgi:hypothetical protein
MLQAMHTRFGWTNERWVHAAVILLMRQRAMRRTLSGQFLKYIDNVETI